MAPEVHRNEIYNHKADVFSFGMILYWLLEGQPPFNSKTGMEAAELASNNSRPSFKIGGVVKEPCVRDCIGLTRRCWAARASARPEASEICDEIEKLIAACPRPSASTDSARRALRRFNSDPGPTRAAKPKAARSLSFSGGGDGSCTNCRVQ